MDKLPLPAVENIVSYLNSLDCYNAIDAFNWDGSLLASSLTSKITLAYEYRLRHQLLYLIIGNRKKYIKELDLTGIFWIPRHVIIKAFLKMENLENLYLFGTSVVIHIHELSNTFVSLPKIQYVAVEMIDNLCVHGSRYHLLKRRMDSQQNAIKFDTVLSFIPQLVKPIVSEEWLSLVKAGVTSDVMNKEIDLSFTEIKYSDFLVNEQKIKEFLFDLKDVKTLIVRRPVGCQNLNIEPIKFLRNLTYLHVDVGSVGQMFLKPILQSCSNLKMLHIKCYMEMFSFSHLKYASKNLQDLSVHMSNAMHFNMAKFFFDIKENPLIRLRRLSLQYGSLTPDTKPAADAALRQYMNNNPQLIFVYICNSDVVKNANDLKRLLRKFKREPHQFFACKHTNDIKWSASGNHRPNIPVQHLDMFDV